MIELKIIFGTDQKKYIDNVLNKLIEDGMVNKFSSVIKEEHAYYEIEFIMAYGIYLFGRESKDLFKYIYKEMENKEKTLTNEDIYQWSHRIVAATEKIFEKQGEVPPMLIGLSESGETVFMPIEELGGDRQRDALAETFKFFAQKQKFIACVFISEVWLTKRKIIPDAPQTYDVYGRPSEQPDRIEAVSISCETKDNVKQVVFEIKRDKAKPYLSLMDMGDHKSAGGRFTNFLSRSE